MNPRAILIINVSRIGDTLLATPAIRAIAAKWPFAQIDVMGHPNRVEVVKNLSFIRHAIPISKKSAPWRGWLGLISRPYDLAFVYGHDAQLVEYGLRVGKHVVAFRQHSDRINKRLATLVERAAFQADHSVNLALALPAALDIQPDGLRLSYRVTDEEHTWVKSRLELTVPASGKSLLVGLQIASFPTKSYRDWPLQSFMSLCDRIHSSWPSAHFLIFGGPEEAERTEALASHLGATATLFAGRVTLRETGALMSQLALYVGVDTGPTHLMSCFDIPMVGLYHGFSRSELIAPLEHPCFYPVDHPRAGPDCPTDAPMSEITVDRVWSAVQLAMAHYALS